MSVTAPLTHFLPVRLEQDDWGRAWAIPAPTNGSGDLPRLAGTDGFVELPPGPNTYPKGFVTPLLPLVLAHSRRSRGSSGPRATPLADSQLTARLPILT